MNPQLLYTMALVAVSVFCLLLVVSMLSAWLPEQIALAKDRAIQKAKRRAQQEYLLRQRQLGLLRFRHHNEMLAHGRGLIDGGPEVSYKDLIEVYGLLNEVYTSLAKTASDCFHVLKMLAVSHGETSLAYKLADRDPERRRLRFDVQSIALAGLNDIELLGNVASADPSLILWKANLQKLVSSICPACPVVLNPSAYPLACPAMTMAQGGSKTSVRSQAEQQE